MIQFQQLFDPELIWCFGKPLLRSIWTLSVLLSLRWFCLLLTVRVSIATVAGGA
jgi:hypothetical protein